MHVHTPEALAPTAPEYELTGQPTHTVAPIFTEYVPAPQSEQTALPLSTLYLPATHNPHAPGSPVLPAAQANRQAPKAVLPAGETAPSPHEVQALVFVTPDHVPDGHVVHWPLEAPLSGPLYPALHRQFVAQTAGMPYTSTSSKSKFQLTDFDILTYLADPAQTCVLLQGATMAPVCPVAQVVKVLPSFESCILKPANCDVEPHTRFQIFRYPIGCVICKSTCHQCSVLAAALCDMKDAQPSFTPSLPLDGT